MAMRYCLLMLLFPMLVLAQGNVDKPKVFVEYLTKHQLSEADRTKVYNALKGADNTESMMALLILDRHTHSDSIPHLIQFAAKHKGTASEKEVQRILAGHLYCTEHWQRAVTEA